MKLLVGFTALLCLQLAGEIVTRLFALPIPGPVVGLFLLLVALPLIPGLAELVDDAAQALLAHLSLLFIPAGVGVIVYIGRLDGVIVAASATLVGSTVIGLCVTALTLQRLMRGRSTRLDDAGDATISEH